MLLITAIISILKQLYQKSIISFSLNDLDVNPNKTIFYMNVAINLIIWSDFLYLLAMICLCRNHPDYIYHGYPLVHNSGLISKMITHWFARKQFLVERFAKKVSKQDLDINFLVSSRDEYVYLKLTWKANIKSNSIKKKTCFYQKILLNNVDNKQWWNKELRLQYILATDDLNATLTSFKQQVLKIAINWAAFKN